MPTRGSTGRATSTASGLPSAGGRTHRRRSSSKEEDGGRRRHGHTGSNSTRGEDRDPSVDRPRDRPPAARGAGGAGPCGDAFHSRLARRARPSPKPASGAPTHGSTGSGRESAAPQTPHAVAPVERTESGTCLRARRTLSSCSTARRPQPRWRRLPPSHWMRGLRLLCRRRCRAGYCLRASRTWVCASTAPQVKRKASWRLFLRARRRTRRSVSPPGE